MASYFKNLKRSGRSSDWVTLPVNLRTSQYEALSRFADELGISVSRATRRLVAACLEELEAEAAKETE